LESGTDKYWIFIIVLGILLACLSPSQVEAKNLFIGTPPGLAGIVVLTDTDQTNEGVIAHYSSIIMMSK